MKLHLQHAKQGSILIVTMIFVVGVAGILVGYLALVQNSRQLVGRAQAWNSALAIAEAGIEDGLARVNAGYVSGNLTRNMNGGTYAIQLIPGNTATIISTGMVTVAKTGDKVSRAVKVTASRQGKFAMGLVAVNNIRFNGNGISSDSWNSHNPLQSTNGLYNNYVGTNGDVASVQGLVDIGNHTISGNLYLGPSATYSGTVGQVLGMIYTDANLSFSDVTVPTTDSSGNTIAWNPAPTTTTGSGKKATSVHDITTSGYYTVSDSTSVIIEPGVNATISVQSGNWNPTSVDIGGGTTNSGNAVLYIQSGTITMAGNSSGGASGNRPENLFYLWPAWCHQHHLERQLFLRRCHLRTRSLSNFERWW